jgi:hypothetical protein
MEARMFSDSNAEIFFTDKELCARWRCSAMKLWRLRQQGKLKTVKIAGVGVNLTPASEVKALEVAIRGGAYASAT